MRSQVTALFGSFARATAISPQSDVDILLEFEETPTLVLNLEIIREAAKNVPPEVHYATIWQKLNAIVSAIARRYYATNSGKIKA